MIILDALYCVGGMLLSTIVFSALFEVLNKSKYRLFAPLQNYCFKIKRKEFLKAIIFFTVGMGLSVIMKKNFSLSYFEFGISLGLFNALINISFKSGITYE